MKKALLGVALIALLALGCFEGEVTTPEETYPEPTSPVNALKLVAISFNQGKVELLKPELSPDFVFYFDPQDIGRSPPGSQYVIPEWWSYTEFRHATKNMFDKAYSINLSITTSGVGTPGENETTHKAENIKISLLVMIDELNGFIADGGYCNFAFERYETEKGKKYWRLTKWWDRTSGSFDEYPGTSPTSLGRVLAMYR
jgi:hypothetical protein